MRLTRADILPLTIFAGLWVVGPLVVFILIWQAAPQYRLGAAITFGSLLLAFGLMILLESSRPGAADAQATKRSNQLFFRLFLASAIGVCIGIAMLIGIGLCSWPQWIVAAIALPAGIALFVLCCVLAG